MYHAKFTYVPSRNRANVFQEEDGTFTARFFDHRGVYMDASDKKGASEKEVLGASHTFVVPNYDEDPDEDDINALDSVEIDWSGDECGVIFPDPESSDDDLVDRDVVAHPGDVVAIFDDGTVAVGIVMSR